MAIVTVGDKVRFSQEFVDNHRASMFFNKHSPMEEWVMTVLQILPDGSLYLHLNGEHVSSTLHLANEGLERV